MTSDKFDITRSMLEFKEAVRHVWNTYFEHGEAAMSPEIQDAFTAVEKGLLQAIVLYPCGQLDRISEYRRNSLSFLLVTAKDELRELYLQVGAKDTNGNSVWSMPTSIDANTHMRLEFVEFFDWLPYGHLDLPLVRVRVAAMDGRPDLVGVDALIQQRHVRFVCVCEQ